MARLRPLYSNLTLLLTASAAFGQGARGTVQSASLKVYQHMSADSEAAATLQKGATVQIDTSITSEGGTWCGISSIESRARLGYVLCAQLQLEVPPPKPSTAPAPPEPPAVAETAAVPRGPLTSAQMAWGLAASALLTESNLGRHTTLAPSNRTAEYVNGTKHMLHEQWGIADRASLLLTLTLLDQGGLRQSFAAIGQRVSELGEEEFQGVLASVRDKDAAHGVTMARRYYRRLGAKSLVGWDYARYISLCRWGYSVGYLSEQEAWQGIMHAAGIIQSTFSSWREVGENYLIGREFWSYSQTQQDGRFMREVCERLLANPRSPWNQIPWGLNLGGVGE